MYYVARLLLLLLLCYAGALPAVAQTGETVREIRIEGNQRIEADAVKTYLGITTGTAPSSYDLDIGLKKLYETGFFADISVAQNAGVLTVQVVENPSVNEVIFEGNTQVDKEDLEKEITLRARSIYTRTKVQNDLKRLLDVYRRNGRYSAEITPQIVQLEQNRVNLIYAITEGPKALIEKVSFIGNENYASSTLEKIINSSQERWYQFLSDSDKYDPDRLQYDQELLRKFYYENGYADFKVKSAIAELSPQRDAFYLTFTIEEGEPYRLGNVDVVTKLPSSRTPDLSATITTASGDLYNASEIESSVTQMTDKLGDAGFAFVSINPDIKRRAGKEKIIDLTYNIEEGPKVYVERINIFGNLRTLDEVIRREFKLSEGDAYSASKLKRTEQRLNNLGYFEKVTVDRKPGSTEDRSQLDVEVKEKSTGEISFGAGLSTSDGPIADFGIRERNFLGHGQDLRTKVQVGGKRQQYDLGFTEPYFLGRELEAGFDLYKTRQDYQDNSSFDRESLGVVLRTGYNLSEHLKHQIRYTFEQSQISNVDSNASLFIKKQEGKSNVSMIGQSFLYDYRDNKFSPTSGYFLRLNQDVAGLGGDNQFLRHELQGEYYIPVAKKWTLVNSGSAGSIVGIGKDVPINQRFFIGGKEIRGFANAGLGPRDVATADALGGNNYYAGTAELRFPLGLPDDLGVSGATFVDAGSLWGLDDSGAGINDKNSLRASAGFGVAWASPFGPIRLDFARAFLKEDFDETELIRFNFGTRF
jgi:outer membrane protein insertion porin family